ncbi:MULTISPECIES: N-acetylmuramoyl-L-alanine amidase [Pseudooceanicola]|uniref:N-acetylmuramoyl-L-alanine amidase n=1 Tax=Pseudooceanicola TaxID=1679449 RepID=UPI002880A10D|nr:MULTISPECIES: N-acetylmuramoyl-L-alanine amidase [Pseudooceanicola]
MPVTVTGAPGALWHPSENHGARRDAARPDLIVLHHTAMDSAEAALERLCDPAPPQGLSPVSAHYLIAEDGRLWQLVDEAARAWHAGVGQWGDVVDVNSRSIGIELANPAPNPFAEPQMARLEALLPGIMARWDIPPARVIGHSDMAPGRKSDPGPKFDWRRLARQGLAVWPEGAGAGAPGDFLHDLAAIGYRMPEGGVPEILLEAFRMRFRPWGRGPLGTADRALAAQLARQVPVRRG